MDNVTTIGIITLIGAMAGVFIPYIMKVWKDPALEFDVNYGYLLLLNIIVQVGILIPDDVPVLTLKVAINAFVAGFGSQAIINKAVPKGV